MNKILITVVKSIQFILLHWGSLSLYIYIYKHTHTHTQEPAQKFIGWPKYSWNVTKWDIFQQSPSCYLQTSSTGITVIGSIGQKAYQELFLYLIYVNKSVL